MSTADFVFIESKTSIFLDLQAFCTSLREKFPGILIRERTNPEKAYSLSWDYQSPQLTLESSLSSKKNVFVINYFDSTNRLQDYASYIIRLRKWFPPEEKVSFCDEGYEYVFELPSDLSQKAASILTNHPEQMNIDYQTSSGHSFIASKMSDSAMTQLKQTVAKNVTETYTKALFYALQAIGNLKGNVSGYESYFEIPENKESHYDIIYRNVRLNTDFECVLDIAVQYKEIKTKASEEIEFIPYVAEVGDIGKKKGWKEIDCTGKKFVCDKKYPKIDAPLVIVCNKPPDKSFVISAPFW